MTSTLYRSDRFLALSRTVLRLLIKLNATIGILILALLVATLVAGPFVMHALGVVPMADNGRLLLSMRGIMLIGVLGAPVVHLVFSRLLAIVETVNAGDPFVGDNAARLQIIAWAIVGLEVLHVGVVV
ncbi:MAG: hypothetical protein JWP08_1462, partial [Bryobacterales bacterium]|nr:hypothetical protein [Bryobacterales bacterium]